MVQRGRCPTVSAMTYRRLPLRDSLAQLIVQGQRMLGPVPNRRRAVAAQAPQLSRTRASNDEVGLLRHAVLEYSGALQYEAARLPCDLPDDPLEADERGRAVAAVHHQVFDMPLTHDIARERLCDGGPSQLWQVPALAIGLFVPALDGESGVRNVLHVFYLGHVLGTIRALAIPARASDASIRSIPE